MKFSTRDLVWLTMVAALALSWWLDHRHANHDRLRLKRALFAEQRAHAQERVAAIDERVKVLTAIVREAERRSMEASRQADP